MGTRTQLVGVRQRKKRGKREVASARDPESREGGEAIVTGVNLTSPKPKKNISTGLEGGGIESLESAQGREQRNTL